MNADRQELQAKLQQLQDGLSSRESTRHFAHAGIALIAAMIFAGASAKLFWDSLRTPILGFATATLALGLAIYSVVHYLRGRRDLRDELQRFASLQALRRTLNVDDPASLLPR